MQTIYIELPEPGNPGFVYNRIIQETKKNSQMQSLDIEIRMHESSKPVEDVKVDSGTGMADMAEIIGCDATDVHANLTRLLRGEYFLLLRHRIVHPKFLFRHFDGRQETEPGYDNKEGIIQIYVYHDFNLKTHRC